MSSATSSSMADSSPDARRRNSSSITDFGATAMPQSVPARASGGAPFPAAPGPATVAAAMALFLVRHAHAGRRRGWDGPDDQRPLSSKGEKEALGLADRLESKGITHLVSSPAL